MLRYILVACLIPIAWATEALAQGLGDPSASPWPSQPYAWKNVKIGAGGFITGIVFSPKEKGLAYVRTDIGGAYRMDAKEGRWVPLLDWVGPGNANLMGVESVAADPIDPDKVYLALGTYSSGAAAIARSADRGATFAISRVPITMGGNENGRGMGERLAVDPSDNRVLYFGSRRDGLWRSGDGAENWQPVESFPAGVAAVTGGRGGISGSPGISWVIFDVRAGQPAGQPTASVFAGVASGGASSLYRSVDAGKAWRPIEGGPVGMMPHRAVIDQGTHSLYITYGNGPGPNDVTAGAVYKYEIDAHRWTNITPPYPGNGGWGGIVLDPQRPGTLMVSTIDHWSPGDEIFRSTDGGQTWKGIAGTSTRDAALAPYLFWGQRQPRFGWWIAALALDPFDSDHVMYGTGATIWGTREMTFVDQDRPTRWTVAADGIEENAVLALISPPAGPPLISGVGDTGGFTHDDLDISPPDGMHENPRFTNTNLLDVAWLKPSVVVRAGTPGSAGAGRNQGPTAAISQDGGKTWRALTVPANAAQVGGGFFGANAYFVLSSDGESLLTLTAEGGALSRDLGVTWAECRGLPAGLRPVADRVAGKTFYAIDPAAGRLYTSVDGGANFSAAPMTGLPATQGRGRGGGGGLRIATCFARAGGIWVLSGGSLYRSSDGGATFAAVPSAAGPAGTVNNFTLGRAAPGRDQPALFITGTLRRVTGFYRSDDQGATWVDINDARQQFGALPTVIAGDPRVYGRLYIGTNGRGILYGDPAPRP